MSLFSQGEYQIHFLCFSSQRVNITFIVYLHCLCLSSHRVNVTFIVYVSLLTGWMSPSFVYVSLPTGWTSPSLTGMVRDTRWLVRWEIMSSTWLTDMALRWKVCCCQWGKRGVVIWPLTSAGACEASLACTTCHVYVSDGYYDKLPEALEEYVCLSVCLSVCLMDMEKKKDPGGMWTHDPQHTKPELYQLSY